MASRVNTKFVAILAVVLLALVGVAAFIGYSALKKSADDLIKLGDEAAAKGEHDKAVVFFAKAVNKDQRNAEWIRRWIGALEKVTPKSRQAYSDMYAQQYLNALRSHCDSDRTNLKPFLRYLDEQVAIAEIANQLSNWEQVGKIVDDLLRVYQGDDNGKKQIARYRGLAIARSLLGNSDAKEDRIRAALVDLDAGIAARPDDWQAALAANDMQVLLAELARKRDDQPAKSELMQAARNRLVKFNADHPPAPYTQFRLLILELSEAARAYQESAQKDKEAFPGPQLLKNREDRLKEVVDGLRALKPDQLDPSQCLGIAAFAADVFPDGEKTAAELIDLARKANPQYDAALTIGEGGLFSGRGQSDKGEALFRRVLEMPEMPLSLQGLRLSTEYRSQAIALIAELTFQQWRTVDAGKEPTRRDELTAKFDKLRSDMVARVGETDVNVLALDARLLLMRGDLAGARVKTTSYNEQTGRRNIPMLMLEGNVLYQLSQFGAARQVYARVLQLDPRNLEAIMQMGQIEAQSGNIAETARWFNLAGTISPGNTAIRDAADRAIKLAKGGGDSPVFKAIKEAQALTVGMYQDLPKAIGILREAQKQAETDPILARTLAVLLMQNNQRAEARQVVQQALAVNVGNPELTSMSKLLAIDDPVQAQIAVIDSMVAPEFRKALAKYEVCVRAAKPEDARKFLAQAAQAAPDDPNVIEALFSDAIARKDSKELTRLAALAETNNVDQLNGLSFRARVEIVEKRYDDAIKTLREATNRDKFNVLGWRLLGMVQFERREMAAAADALSKAVELKPDDLPAVKAYAKALITLGRLNDALSLMRRAEDRAGSDSEFADILLALESEAPGGDKTRAITARTRIAEVRPDDRGNKGKLAVILINEKRFDEAKKFVDEFTKDPLDPVGVELQAGFLAAQGKFQEAVDAFTSYIERLPEDKRTPEPFISGARLLMQYGFVDAAFDLLKKGRPYQDKKTNLIDREIGDLAFGRTRYTESAEAYQRILDTGAPDEDNMVLKRVLECLLRDKKYAEVDAKIKALGEAAQRDVTLLLLSAESAIAQNDRNRARTLYDQAVRIEPKNSLVYLKRADFNLPDPSMFKDVVADYEQVIRNDPTAVIARVRLANLYRQNGDVDKAIDQFKQAVNADPFDDQLRMALIDLYMQKGLVAEATTVVEDLIRIQPNNVAWLARGALLMSRIDRHDKAAEYLEQVWRVKPTPEIATMFGSALLSKNPPDIAGVNALLQAPESKADSSISVRMLKARWFRAQRKLKEATAEVLATLNLLNQDSRDESLAFMAGMDGVYPKTDELITALDRIEEQAPFRGWMAYHAATARIRIKDNIPKVATTIQAIAPKTQDSSLRGIMFLLLGQLAYTQGSFDQAVAHFSAGLEADPENPALANNLAYCLSVKLNKHDQALPLAEKAVAKAPNNSGFVDTLAAVYIGKKDYNRAAELLAQAIGIAQSDAERAPVFLHLARVRLEQGNKPEARRLARQAQDILGSAGGQLETDLAELKKRIEAP